MIAAVLLLASCAPSTPQIVEVTVPVPIKETVVVTQEVAATAMPSFSTPHPLLGDRRVRQAIAYCADRDALIRSVYPFVTDPDILRLDTFLPRTHWAYAANDPNVVKYEYDPDRGRELLEEAGWTLPEGAIYRTNAAGEPLALTLTTTDAQFRQVSAAVFQASMKECGIRLLRFHTPFDWWLGPASGLSRRDFELGAYAWTSQAEPEGASWYSCDQIPRPENDWLGQNYMGWCNPEASAAIEAANHSLLRQERIPNYRIAQEAFTQDMVSLPLFYRAEVAAASKTLAHFQPNSTDDYLWNVHEWELQNSETALIGAVETPETLFPLIEKTKIGRMVARLIYDRPVTSLDYDHQPNLLLDLPTLESGLALNNEVEVREGDMVWDANRMPAELQPGTLIANAAGEVVEYTGGAARMKQLVVTYEWRSGLTFSDGEPLTAGDFELAYRIDCDPASGAGEATLTTCRKIQDVVFSSDTSYQVTWKPGVQDPLYYLPPIGYYPAHRVLSDGHKLADVPAAEWAHLPEIVENPIGVGPYQIKQWDKGVQIVLGANPYYWRGADTLRIKTIVFLFYAGPTEATDQFLNGAVDVLGPDAIGIGREVEDIMSAAQAGAVQAWVIPTSVWEHVDLNLYVR